MVKIRILTLAITLLVITVFGSLSILYARGYRLGFKEQSVTLSPRGLLSVTSNPSGAQIFVDDKLETATDNTISLSPGHYAITVKKEGFQDWSKEVEIKKEIVTQIHAFLVPGAPSLTALTFSGAIKPQINKDLTKIAYAVPKDKEGLWAIETTNLPLGFNREPRQITDGDLTEATWEWSPDSHEILLTTKTGMYLLDTTKFTSQAQRTNMKSQEKEIRADWKEKETKLLESQLTKLPTELSVILKASAKNIQFSPNEDKLIYTATENTNIPENLISPLPGASTQPEERSIKKGKTYVYDIKEDRNFSVGEEIETIYWLPNSHNLLVPSKDQIAILDYDGTNRHTVFSGNYIFPSAYPASSFDRILILTNLGAQDSSPNLYWLSLK